jgi:hypothetical protein
MAMQGILADPNVFKAEAAANLAIECADALLEELAK